MSTHRSPATRRWAVAGVVVAAVVVVAPLLASDFWVTFATSVAISALAALGLAVVMGHGGMLDLGHAGYFGLGAYVTVIWARDGHRPVLLGAGLGVVIATVAGLVVAVLVVRLAGLALALGTLAVGLLAQSVAGGLTVTGRNLGTTGPTRRLVGDEVITATGLYVTVVAILAAVTGVVWWWSRSRSGRSMALLRSAPDAAEALGIATTFTRVRTFVAGAAISGLAGACSAVALRFVDPGAIGLARSIDLLTIVVIGGALGPIGPTVGAVFVRALPEVAGPFADYETIVAGLAFLVVLRFVPGGLSALPRRLARPTSPRGPEGPPPERSESRPPGVPSGAVRASSTTSVPLVQPSEALLRATDLAVSFGGVVAADGVSLTIHRGEAHGLVGANGAGKSTVLDLIGGFTRPTRGTIEWEGVAIDRWSPHRRARLGLCRTFQLGGLAPQLTLRDNILIGMRAERRRDACERTDAIVEWLGLGVDAHRRPADVSAAVGRLAEVGRCLATGPRLMVLDEPGAGLDEAELARLVQVLRAVRDAGVAVLLVEHDLDLVASCCDTVTRLDAGTVAASGPTRDLLGVR